MSDMYEAGYRQAKLEAEANLKIAHEEYEYMKARAVKLEEGLREAIEYLLMGDPYDLDRARRLRALLGDK